MLLMSEVFINFSSSLFDIRYHTSCDLQNMSTQKKFQEARKTLTTSAY